MPSRVGCPGVRTAVLSPKLSDSALKHRSGRSCSLSPHPRRAMLDGCSTRLQCSCRIYQAWRFSSFRNHSRSVRTQARYAPSDEIPGASDMYGMKPSGLATPREVLLEHMILAMMLIELQVGALPEPVRGWSGECEEGLVCGVRASSLESLARRTDTGSRKRLQSLQSCACQLESYVL